MPIQVPQVREAGKPYRSLPWRLRKFVRTTNLVERSFVEERRRSKTLPRFFTEQSCVKLVFATLIRAQADGDLRTLRAHGLDAVRVGREVL